MNRRALPLLLAALLVIPTPSCFTTWILTERTPWDSEEEEDEPYFDEDEGEGEGEDEEEGWAEFLGRLGLVPITLVLDLVTLPLQVLWWPDDEEENEEF